MRKLVFVLLLMAACDGEPIGLPGPDGIDDWRVAEYDSGGVHVRTWYCDHYEVLASGALACYFSGGGLITLASGTFVLTPL